MARIKLNDKQKERIVELYEAKVPQSQIATFFAVSPRTIDRVLQERGLKLPDGEAREIVEIVQKHNLNAETLTTALNQPPLTPENIRHVLSSMTTEQLGTFFYSIVAVKVRRDHETMLAQATAAQTPTQESLPV